MKIVVTGSLGHISKPLATALLAKGHAVTVVSSDPEKRKAIEALGATAAIGNMEDVDFLTTAFAGADAVYCMFPPPNFFDPHVDLLAHIRLLANNYKQAIEQTGVKRVLHLSSIGAHTDQNNGMLEFHHAAEHILRSLPESVVVRHLRPVGFYYNLLSFIPAIRAQGSIASNYGGDDRIAWVSPLDIAAVAAEELTGPFEARGFRYVASDETTCNEVARALGTAIGMPDLQWTVIPDEDLLARVLKAGMNPAIAKGYVEMNAAMHRGDLFDHYNLNRPAVLGKVKIEDFARDFAAVYHQ